MAPASPSRLDPFGSLSLGFDPNKHRDHHCVIGHPKENRGANYRPSSRLFDDAVPPSAAAPREGDLLTRFRTSFDPRSPFEKESEPPNRVLNLSPHSTSPIEISVSPPSPQHSSAASLQIQQLQSQLRRSEADNQSLQVAYDEQVEKLAALRQQSDAELRQQRITLQKEASDKLERHEQELYRTLQEQRAAMHQEVQRVEDWKATMEQELVTENRRLAGREKCLREQAASLDERERELESIRHDLNSEQSELRLDRENLEKTVLDVEQQSDHWKKQHQQAKDQLNELRQKTSNEHRKLQEAQRARSEYEKEDQISRAELRRQIEDLQLEMDHLSSERDALETNVQESREHSDRILVDLAHDEQRARDQLKELQRQLKIADQQLTATLSQISVAQRERDRLQIDVDTMQTHLTTEEDRWHSRERELNQLSRELERKRSKQEVELETIRSNARLQIEQEVQDCETEKKRRIEETSAKIQEMTTRNERELCKLQTEQSVLDQTRQVLSTEQEKLRQENAALDATKSKLRREIVEFQKKQQQANKTQRQADERYKTSGRELDRARKELEHCRRENKALRSQLEQSENKIQSNQQKLKDLANRLEQQASTLNQQQVACDHDRERFEMDYRDRLRTLKHRENELTRSNQKRTLVKLLSRSGTREQLSITFSKWARLAASECRNCQRLQRECEVAKERELRSKREAQNQIRILREKERELYNEIEQLKKNDHGRRGESDEADFNEREKQIAEANERIRNLVVQLRRKEMDLEMREADLVERWRQDDFSGLDM